MTDKAEIRKEIRGLTLTIESLALHLGDDQRQAELADLYFARAELYFQTGQNEWAIEDYEACLELNPYFYEADMGREMVYLAMQERVAA